MSLFDSARAFEKFNSQEDGKIMAESWMLFFSTFLIGVSIAAPVGPIGILCIRRTLAHGKLVGFLSGMGAATADTVYGAIAAFGITIVTNSLVENTFWLRILGGCFLLYLGIKTFLEKPADHAAKATQSGYLSAYLSTFFLTITNPMTILAFIAIFTGPILAHNSAWPLVLVAGIFTGSAFWWLSLSFGVGLLRDRLTTNHMTWINRISGSIIIIFSLKTLFSL